MAKSKIPHPRSKKKGSQKPKKKKKGK